MAIHNQVDRSMAGGFRKGIEASAEDMMIDLVQKSQYQYPIPSTVRELVSNAIDSNNEKDMARNILSGLNTVQDYFVEREGELFQDSKFDPTYYDLNWLSEDNTVIMDYAVGGELDRDRVTITDYGVGLGSYRLEKYFQLGYSTKRLSKVPLGKFGIGGKAALSIGWDSYVMESRYNGRLYRFNVYSHSGDSIIPQWNLETGEENESILFGEGTDHEYRVYYEKTELKNGVTVIVEAKKHHKQQYINAVKSQLLYFPNIRFTITDNGNKGEIAYQATILYEDEHIILSDNSYWSKPHILLNKVNYGYINFEELELEDKNGNIGIKIAPEDVEVNPSRETITWGDKTKLTVLEKFNTVKDIAQKIIQEQLQETDYLDWIRACYSLTGKVSADRSVIGRLAKIIDIANVKPSFVPEPRLRFQQTKVLNGLYVRSVKMEKKYIANVKKSVISRKETRNMSDIFHQPIYLMDSTEKASNRKDKYLYSKFPEGFILVMAPLTSREGMLSIGMTEEYADSMLALFNKEDEEFRNILATSWEFLKNSRDVTWYKDVEIPEDFTGTDEPEEDEDIVEAIEKAKNRKINAKYKEQKAEVAKIAQQSRLERRKLEGKTLIYTPRMVKDLPKPRPLLDNYGVQQYDNDKRVYLFEPVKLFDWQKIEIPIKEMNDWTSEEIYYGIGPGSDELLNFVAMLSRHPNPENVPGAPIRRTITLDMSNHGVFSVNAEKCQQFYENPEIMLIKASVANARYMRDFQPITQFFQTIRNNTVTMSNLLIRWNTARIIKQKLDKAKFLFNFETFNPIYAKHYSELKKYINLHYRDVTTYTRSNYFGLDETTYNDLIKHLDKITQFQEFVASTDNVEAVATLAVSMFGNKEIQDGHAVDPSVISILKKVLEFADQIGTMFNYMPILTDNKVPIPSQLEMEIKNILDARGLLDYGQDEEEDKQFLEELSIRGQQATIIPDEEPTKEPIQDIEYVEYLKNIAIQDSKFNEVKVLDEVTHVHRPDVHEPGDLELPEDQSIMQTF